jgi:hypothetical protein
MKDVSMSTEFLDTLIPGPIRITGDLSGELYIDGNISQSQILFRFKFDNEREISPVIIHIELAGEHYQYCCYIHDFGSHVMRTGVLKFEFSIPDRIVVKKVEPLIEYVPEVEEK